MEGSGFDTKSLNFSFEADLGKDRQGRKALNLEPALAVDEAAWLASLSELSSLELAKRLGITDRQVRRIRAGKVTVARLREHAKADAFLLRRASKNEVLVTRNPSLGRRCLLDPDQPRQVVTRLLGRILER